jgi:hypothetical protein
VGYDSNPLQAGLFEPTELHSAGTSTGSALSTVEAGLAYRFSPADRWLGELAYGFQQVAYLDPTAADRSLQLHALNFSLQRALSEQLRAGFLVTGEMDLTGLGGLRGLQRIGRFGAFAALDESATSTTRVDLAVSRKAGLSEFSYLSGNRLDAAVTQQLLSREWTLDLGYAFRLEDIGSAPVGGQCFGACPPQPVEDFGYAAHSFWAAAKMSPLSRFTFSMAAGVELRSYLDDSLPQKPQTATRSDQLYFANATASVRATSALALSMRWDLFDNQSNAEGIGAPGLAALPDRRYVKQMVSVGTLLWW